MDFLGGFFRHRAIQELGDTGLETTKCIQIYPTLPKFTQIYKLWKQPNTSILGCNYWYISRRRFARCFSQVLKPKTLEDFLKALGKQLNQWFRHLKSNCLASLKIEGYLKIWGVSRIIFIVHRFTMIHLLSFFNHVSILHLNNSLAINGGIHHCWPISFRVELHQKPLP